MSEDTAKNGDGIENSKWILAREMLIILFT